MAIYVHLSFHRGQLKHRKPRFRYPAIISDVSSDDDDTLHKEKFDKKRNYHFTTYDPEHKLANQMHRRIFQNRKQIRNNHLQKNDHVKSNSPKKHSVKPSFKNVKKNNIQLRRIISSHSVKYSLDSQKNNSQSYRITSVKEANCGQTLQSKTQEQALSVKTKVLTERITQIDTPQKTNEGRMSSMKDGGLLSKETYVMRLEREREYLMAILQDDMSTTDLNSLCAHKENDAEVHLLLNVNVSHTEKDKQIKSQEVLTLLPSNEEPISPFFPIGEKGSSEISHTASPPAVDLTLSHSSPEIRKTSTPCSQATAINSPISPIKYPGRLSKTSSVSTHQSEIRGEITDNLSSPAAQNVRSDKYRITLRGKNKNKKNSTEMGYVRLYVFIYSYSQIFDMPPI
jgi:hypothetical protein